MPLTPGSRIGVFEITARIGVGGMGEVYQATDTNLKRQVAIKVLPDAVAGDAERLARFQREAEVLASLNHPNIAAIHGLEKSDGQTALVMELVEGPTLADRIAQGAIPVDEALSIAKQIAEALEAAHEQGIIHRDLKPANIKLRPDGTVKVLDFGLAKAMEPAAAASPSMSMSPTITTPAMTQAGLILGTAAYMPPEQARGKPVDRRADIWAFGCVLYEMLTGKRAFEAEDISLTLAEVMKSEPDFGALPGSTPVGIRQALSLCFQKDPKQRGGDIAAIRLALEGAFSVDLPPEQASTAGSGLRLSTVLAVVAALLVGALGASILPWTTETSLPPRLARFPIGSATSLPLNPSDVYLDLALASDGSAVVYRSTVNESAALAVRRLDATAPTLLYDGGGFNVVEPFISPDGASVGFFNIASREIRRISINGGPPSTVTETVTQVRGATWGESGQIVFGTDDSGLWQVSADGGVAEPLTTPDESLGEIDHRWPSFLPGGEALLFTVRYAGRGGPDESAQIVVLDLTTGQRRVLISAGSFPRYSSTGHIVYGFAETLRAVPFDLDRLEVTGDPVQVLGDVMMKPGGATEFDVAGDGSLLYATGAFVRPRTLVWVDREGNEQPVGAEARTYEEFTLSPDGTRVAIRTSGEGAAVWVLDLTRGLGTPLNFGTAQVGILFPTWTPDGARVAFGGPLSWKRADGIGDIARLDEATRRFPQAFTPDGNALLFVDRGADGNGIGVLPLGGDGAASLVVDGPFNEREAALSPDGRWLAYNSDETGEWQVFVRPFPEVDGYRLQISTDGGEWPVWNPVANELFYRGPAGIMVLEYEADSSFTPGALTLLIEREIVGARNRRMAVSPDGQRFLLLQDEQGSTSDDDAGPAEVVLVQNWFVELERLVPTP